MILTAVFADKVGLIYGQTETFIHHIYALGIVTTFVLSGSYVLYRISDITIPVRVSDAEEDMGLDLSQHGESLDEIGTAAETRLPTRAVVATSVDATFARELFGAGHILRTGG
jgi:Amt family ammonium transporter